MHAQLAEIKDTIGNVKWITEEMLGMTMRKEICEPEGNEIDKGFLIQTGKEKT